MKKLFLATLLVTMCACAMSAPTLYGPNGIVTYPTASSGDSLVCVTPYVMTYGGDDWTASLVANVDLGVVEAYGSISVYDGEDFSFDELSSYGAKVKIKTNEDSRVAVGATMFADDRVDIYGAISNEIFDLSLIDLNVTCGVNYQTTKNDYNKGDTRVFAGATTKLTDIIKVGAEASLPLNGPSGTIYSLGASVDLFLLKVNAGMTNNKNGYKSDDMGYFVNMGYTFSLL